MGCIHGKERIIVKSSIRRLGLASNKLIESIKFLAFSLESCS